MVHSVAREQRVYNDTKAREVITFAEHGDESARTLLCKVAIAHLDRSLPLPKNLLSFARKQLDRPMPAGRGAKPADNALRDGGIFLAVNDAKKQGFKLSRNDATRDKSGDPSACSIVKDALDHLGIPLGERRIFEIHEQHDRRLLFEMMDDRKHLKSDQAFLDRLIEKKQS